MKVRGGQCDVPQRRHLENVLVRHRLCNTESTLVVGRQKVRSWLLHDTERRVHAAPYVDSAVARGTPLVDERPQSALLPRGERRSLASQISVERRIWRDERRLEDGYCLLRVRERKGIRLSRKCTLECSDVTRDGGKLLADMLLWGSHLDRIHHRTSCLRFEILGPPVPKLCGAEYRIENGGCVPSAALPPMADGSLLGVDPAEPYVVAGVAADRVACR